MKNIIKIGQSATMVKIITQENICKFAEISEDCNPIHLDDGFASKSIFKD